MFQYLLTSFDNIEIKTEKYVCMCVEMITVFVYGCREKFLAAAWSAKFLVNWQHVRVNRPVDDSLAEVNLL